MTSHIVQNVAGTHSVRELHNSNSGTPTQTETGSVTSILGESVGHRAGDVMSTPWPTPFPLIHLYNRKTSTGSDLQAVYAPMAAKLPLRSSTSDV